MSFPCLICWELPIVDQPATPNPISSSSSLSSSAGGIRTSITANSSAIAKQAQQKQIQSQLGQTQTQSIRSGVGGGGGTTIRSISKDVSDKIFQNLCKQLSIKSEPNWFIQNPGEQMPLCAACSASVLEIYTLQTKVDQFTAMIKKQVCKLERIVADTEIAANWMATKEEKESEEVMWNSLPCPHATVRIARERHEKFRNQILQNFKNRVKQRMKLRASGQQDYDILESESPLPIPPLEPVAFENGERSEGISSAPSSSISQSQYVPPFKKFKSEKSSPPKNQQSPAPSPSCSSGVGGSGTNVRSREILERGLNPPPSLLSVSSRAKVNPEVHDENEASSDHDQVYPDVQIVYTSGSVDYDIYKDETEYSGDGDESMEHEGSLWYTGEENLDDEEAMIIPDGEEVVWLAHNVVLRKSFLEQLLIENLKPSVFLRKLMFAVFGLKQIANSSGTTGSNKQGAKPSLDRHKFEVLRDYTIDTYGIRDNLHELDDLNRKIRTICCDARKALKRKALRPKIDSQQPYEGFSPAARNSSGPTTTSSNSDDYAEVAGIPSEEVISMNSGNSLIQNENDQD